MKIGIMQPYFLPYIGYFQLIDSVDVYVNLDHVSFMKRSYMVRNVLKKDTKINLNVHNASQNKKCNETLVNLNDNYISKYKKTIHHLYSKSLNYNTITDEIINPCFVNKEITISEFNFDLIRKISNYLLIDTIFVNSSEGLTNKKKGEGLIEITKSLEGDVYVNAIGGQSLYQKEIFEKYDVELKFVKMGNVKFENPYVSILDHLYNLPKDKIIQELKNYILI
jgi:hypothetical protein